MTKHKVRLSKISALHYFKLIFRSALFVAALVTYIVNRVRYSGLLFGEIGQRPIFLAVIGGVFLVEMVLRFFPSNMESVGCQKQFQKNFIPVEEPQPRRSTWKSTFVVAVVWLSLNAVIGGTYFAGWIDAGILVLISLFYSVCDMICILFFCPFQTWFMKNKCCGSCRIYNWDYAMMFTPFVFVPHPFTWGLLGVALLLLLVWEITIRRHPERFFEDTNACLSCDYCQEKLCHHKKQLRRFLRKHKDTLFLKGNAVVERAKQKFGRKNK